MDPLRFAIAAVPLASYFLVLGVVNASRRPMVTTGAADLAALGAALTGLVAVGPIELFRPSAATGDLGNWIWLMLLGLYWLGFALAILVSRPRLVIYNMSLEQLRPALAEAIPQLDPDARWAGDNLVLPRLGVQLHLDAFALMRNVALVSSGGRQNLDGWVRLRRGLTRSLKSTPVRPNARSAGFYLAGAMLIAGSVFALVSEPMQVVEAMGEILAF